MKGVKRLWDVIIKDKDHHLLGIDDLVSDYFDKLEILL